MPEETGKKGWLGWVLGDLAAVGTALGLSEIIRSIPKKSAEAVAQVAAENASHRFKHLTMREKAATLFHILREMGDENTKHINALFAQALRGELVYRSRRWSEDRLTELLCMLIPLPPPKEEPGRKRRGPAQPPKDPYEGVKEDFKWFNDKLGGTSEEKELAMQRLYLLDADGIQQRLHDIVKEAGRALVGSPEQTAELRKNEEEFSRRLAEEERRVS